MIEQYISDVARQMELPLSDVSHVGGTTLGCTDIDLVTISSQQREVGAVIFQSDLELLTDGVISDRLEFGIRLALSRLQKIAVKGGTPQ